MNFSVVTDACNAMSKARKFAQSGAYDQANRFYTEALDHLTLGCSTQDMTLAQQTQIKDIVELMRVEQRKVVQMQESVVRFAAKAHPQ